MIDSLCFVVFAMLAGVLIGTIFFVGLWWTVCRVIVFKKTFIWIFASMLLRMCIVLLGFYFLFEKNPAGWVLGLLGFIIARLIIIRFGREFNQMDQAAQKANHAL